MSKEMPKGFPPFTLHVMRALAVVETSQPEKLEASIAALYKAMWVDAKPIHEPAVFESVLGDVLGKEEAKRVVDEVCVLLSLEMERVADQRETAYEARGKGEVAAEY
jgi:2-hydroxychromene-2-carboxylate isomerase